MGRVLGDRYRVISRLGEGGMGTVYLCQHAVLQRRFAVKVLREDLATDPELVDRFRNEAIAASRIGQENVVDVVDFGTDAGGSLYYVMEALDGRSLGAVIRDEGPLPVARALDVLEQLCRALSAAHARGVVHRDVKPDNVFLVPRADGGERAKVIDFGISHVGGRGERLTRAGAIIGTPEYMAPEQASGAEIDHRADMYGVGVLAFEMLTGALPLEGATPHAAIAAHQTRNPDPPSRRIPGIPPEVDALVLRMLAKRPEDRFASMDELAAEVARIRSVVEGRSAPAAAGRVRPSGAGRPSRPRGETVSLADLGEDLRAVRRSSRAGLAIAIGAVVALAVAATWAWRVEIGRAHGHPDAAPTADSAPTSTATLTPTSTPSATPTPTDAAEPVQGVSAPVLVGAPPDAPGAARGDARAPHAKPHRAPARPADGLKDPYEDDAKLKDPFR